MSNLATNSFNEGLMMDLNPLITPSNVMTNALNATLITFNGNENVLLNDMGNGRVETAFLPEGYIPLGTTELGGIIYIVSYNPLINKCLIGSFPSPERNIDPDEIENSITHSLDYISNFAEFIDENDDYKTIIKTPTKKIELTNDKLNPGDLFLITIVPDQESASLESISDKLSAFKNSNRNPNLDPRYLKLNVVSIEDNGNIVNLNKSLVWNEGYYIMKDETNKPDDSKDLDKYRKLVGSNYTPFTSKTSGKLGLIALLETITNFDCAWDVLKSTTDDKFNFYFFTNWEYDNDEAKDKINLYGIKVDIIYKSVIEKENKIETSYAIIGLEKVPEYPKKALDSTNVDPTNDILTNEDINFLSPAYLDSIPLDNTQSQGSLDNSILRKNDGSDYLFLINKPFNIDPKNVLEDNGLKIININIYPVMPFGTLKYLKRSFTVDLNKLGSGEIDLKEYRYYFDSEFEKITLNWGLEAYPVPGDKIESVDFEFYDYLTDSKVKEFVKYNANNIQDDKITTNKYTNNNDEECEFSIPSNDTITINDQSSYSGNFVNVIDLKERPNINKDWLYLVKININTKLNNNKTYYRFMYTNGIFNEYYTKEQSDFKNINLSKLINKYELNVVLNKTGYTEDEDFENKTTKILGNIIEEEESPEYKTIDYTLIKTQDVEGTFTINRLLPYRKMEFNLEMTSISDQKFDFKPKGEQYSLFNTNQTFEFNGDLNILEKQTSIDIDTKKIKLNYDVKIPINVKYDKTNKVNVDYNAINLKTKSYVIYLNPFAKVGDFAIKEGNKITENKAVDHTPGDDGGTLSGTINDSFPNCKLFLNEELITYDVIYLGTMNDYDTRYDGVNFGSLHFSGKFGVDDITYYTSVMLYAMKSDQGKIAIFTFKSKTNVTTKSIDSILRNGNYSHNWYNTNNNIDTNIVKHGGITIVSPSNLLTSFLKNKDIDKNITGPFELYYKLENSDESVNLRKWLAYFTYKNLSTEITINGKFEYNPDIKLSNNSILLDDNINNLQYNNNEQDVLLKLNIPFDVKEHRNELYENEGKKICKTGSGDIIFTDYDMSYLIDYKGNAINNIKKHKGTLEKDREGILKDSNIKITNVNGDVIIDPSSAQTMNWSTYGRGQTLDLKDIYLIESEL